MISLTPKALLGSITTSILLSMPACLCLAQNPSGNLNELSAYQTAGKNWHSAAAVAGSLSKPSILKLTKGEGILVADAGGNENSLTSLSSYGDLDLNLDFMTTSGSKTTIYLDGIYPITLADDWGKSKTTDLANGFIPGHSPRQYINRAPGLWQHLTLSFSAPRANSAGKITVPAKLIQATLDGVLIHENSQWSFNADADTGKTSGPIRIEPVYGKIALKNINITPLSSPREQDRRESDVDPILVQVTNNTTLRSFMDIPDQRIVHCVSVGSAEQVHYSYDLDKGYLFQIWRGGFLDATPMWHDRGDGSSRVLGSSILLGKPVPGLAKLDNSQRPWPKDSIGTGYFNKGYVLDEQDRPQFKYRLYNVLVTDAIQALPNGTGLSRNIQLAQPKEGWYVLLAKAKDITEQSKDTYLISGQEYYIKLEADTSEKAFIRDGQDGKELLIPIHYQIQYSLIF